MSDRPQRPWACKVEPESPVTPDSKERREKRRQAVIEENRKRPRGELDEVPGADGATGVSLSAPASPPEDVLRPENMKTCRLAGMTPAFFTPAQHLYMCCGRPFVVLVMCHEPEDEMGITSYFAKKFAPATPVVIRCRSYKGLPFCAAHETLFDIWKDCRPSHLMCLDCSSLAVASVA